MYKCGDNLSIYCQTIEKWFLALVGLTVVKDTSALKKVAFWIRPCVEMDLNLESSLGLFFVWKFKQQLPDRHRNVDTEN